jgi:hypothetical protein
MLTKKQIPEADFEWAKRKARLFEAGFLAGGIAGCD